MNFQALRFTQPVWHHMGISKMGGTFEGPSNSVTWYFGGTHFLVGVLESLCSKGEGSRV